MTKEEQQFNQWFDWYADGVKVFEEADMKQAYLQGRADLEKENTELLSKHILELQADKGRLTDKVRELEAEVKEWKDKADLWCKTANLKDHNIMINKELEKENAELKTKKIPQLEKRIASIRGSHSVDVKKLNARIEQVERLQKENAELKAVERMALYSKMSDQLTKAKELLRYYFDCFKNDNKYTLSDFEVVEDTEQFLSEVEK